MKPLVDYTRYDDERLISLITQLHEGALAQLYDRYSRLVFSLALAIIHDRATAEEITLDVFMRVWQKAVTYRADQAKVSTWLTYITRHHAIDVLRRQSARPLSSSSNWDNVVLSGEFPEQNLEEAAEISMRRERIREAVAQLPAEQRQALMLAYFDGYTQSQIAEILKQPLGTIKTRLRLALQKLHNFLSGERESLDTSVDVSSAYNISKEE